jgi:putative NADH-flavin reductase
VKLLIFGASGRTGHFLAAKAAAAGHEAFAFTRDWNRLDASWPRDQVYLGDVLDPATVEDAVRGKDAVLLAVGSGGLGPTTIRQDAARSVVRAMTRQRVSRLVALSTAMAGEVGLPVALVLRPLVFRHVVADARAMESVVRNAGVEYTIVRAPRLRQEDASGSYHTACGDRGRPQGRSVARGAVADAMIHSLARAEDINQVITVSG